MQGVHLCNDVAGDRAIISVGMLTVPGRVGDDVGEGVGLGVGLGVGTAFVVLAAHASMVIESMVLWRVSPVLRSTVEYAFRFATRSAPETNASIVGPCQAL